MISYWEKIMNDNDVKMIETTIEKKNNWTKTKENVRKITKKNNSVLNLKQVRKTKRDLNERRNQVLHVKSLNRLSRSNLIVINSIDRDKMIDSWLFIEHFIYLIHFCLFRDSFLSSFHYMFFSLTVDAISRLILVFRSFDQVRTFNFKDLNFFLKF
jgi:hypothetical protein